MKLLRREDVEATYIGGYGALPHHAGNVGGAVLDCCIGASDSGCILKAEVQVRFLLPSNTALRVLLDEAIG